jgi:hypothetical protein
MLLSSVVGLDFLPSKKRIRLRPTGFFTFLTYTLYRMNSKFGEEALDLTKAIQSLAKRDTSNVKFIPHAEDEMDADGFDHADVMTCLRKGMAFGPETQNNQLRANVIHRGIHIRVVVGGLDDMDEDWSQLRSIKVITVMRYS